MGGPGRPPSRTNMLQQRADQRRRDEDDIVEMRRLLAEISGQEIDDAFMEAFSRGMAEETGALPPPRIVVDAIRESRSAEPRNIADAVRAYYRGLGSGHQWLPGRPPPNRSTSRRPKKKQSPRQRPPESRRPVAPMCRQAPGRQTPGAFVVRGEIG